MDTYDYVSIAIGAYFIIVGLASLVTGKVYSMGKSASKYTEESLKKFARPCGLSNLIAGIGLVLFHVLTNELFKIGSFSVSGGFFALVVAIVVSAVILLVGKRVLVKK